MKSGKPPRAPKDPVDIPGWYFVKKSAGFDSKEIGNVFLSKSFIRSVKRLERDEVRVDWNFKRYVNSLLPIAVYAAFDVGPKGSLIPFFVERQKGLELQLSRSK